MGAAFQASMEKIRTQAGGTQKDVTSLTASVLKMAPSAQQGPQQLADALYHLKSVGLDNAAAMRALKTSSDLAAVGGADLESTTNALAGAWRSGIKGAASFGDAAATVNAIIGAGNMRMADFTEAIGTGILASARTFGVSLKSVGAGLALMTDEGVPAVDAATRLRMSFSLLGAPSSQAEKQLKTIGLTGLDLANALRGPQGIIGAVGLLKSHLDASGLSASQSAALLSRAFGGGRSSSAILTLVNNFETLRRKQQQINDTTGRYGAAVIAQRKTASAQLALLRSGLDTLAVRAGLALLPPLTKFVQFLSMRALPAVANFGKAASHLIPVAAIKADVKSVTTFVSDFLKGLFPAQQKAKPLNIPVRLNPLRGQNAALFSAPVTVPAKLVPFARGGLFSAPLPPVRVPVTFIGPGLKAPERSGAAAMAAQAGGQLSAAQKLGQQLRDAISGGIGNIKWGTVIGNAIRAAVRDAQQIGAAFATLIGKVNWTQVGKQAAFAFVPFAIGLINNLVGALISEAIHHPLDMLTFLASLIPIGRASGIILKIFGKVPLLGPLLRVFLRPMEIAGGMMEKALGKMLGKVFGPVRDLTGGYFHDADIWLSRQGDRIINGLWSGLRRMWGRAATWLGGMYVRFLSPFQNAGIWLAERGRVIFSGLWGGISGYWGRTIAPWLARTYVRFLSPFQNAGIWLAAKGRDVTGGLWAGISGRWAGVGKWLGGMAGRFGGYFARARSWLVSAGRNVLFGLGDGLYAAARSIGKWIGQIGGWIVSAVKGFFGIRSPSRVMMGVGSNILHGLLHGMLSTARDIPAFMRKVFGGMPGALGAIVKKGLVSIEHLPSRALAALRGLGGALGGIWDRLFGGSGGDSGARSGSAAVAQRYAASILSMYHWGQDQMSALIKLWNQESGWNAYAVNQSSGAYGIPQALGHGHVFSLGDYKNQIIWGLNYIRERYGSPAAAWAHEQGFNWYSQGTSGARPGWAVVGELGPELVRMRGGETVLDHLASRLMMKHLPALPGYAAGTISAAQAREARDFHGLVAAFAAGLRHAPKGSWLAGHRATIGHDLRTITALQHAEQRAFGPLRGAAPSESQVLAFARAAHAMRAALGYKALSDPAGGHPGWVRGLTHWLAALESQAGPLLRQVEERSARAGILRSLRGFDDPAGNTLPPGLSLSWNGTGRAEHVTPTAGLDGLRGLLAEQNALLREQNALLRAAPARTGAAVGGALDGTARQAGHRALYSAVPRG